AALVLENLVRIARPKDIVISALGVREGLLYSMLDAEERGKDPLIAAASELNVLRSRSPAHGEELIAWTDRFMASSGLDETAEERRLRPVACLLPDIGWRAPPPHRRGETLNIIPQSALLAPPHPRPPLLPLPVLLPPAAPSSRSLYSSARSPSLPRTSRPACANSSRPACSTAPACSAPRCASPTSFPPRPPACCRRRRWWSSAADCCCASITASRR